MLTLGRAGGPMAAATEMEGGAAGGGVEPRGTAGGGATPGSLATEAGARPASSAMPTGASDATSVDACGNGVSPANAAQGQPLSLTLKWLGGLWAHRYDVYFGTGPTNMTVIGTDLPLGPSETPIDYGTFAISGLQDGTLYYWRIVSKTMANVQKSGPI